MSHRLASWLLAALAVASFVVLAPVNAAADLIASAPASVPASTDQTPTVSNTDAVAGSLRAQGLSEAEIGERLAQMNETDLAQLAQAPQQMQVAGSVADFVLIGLAAIIIGVIIYLID